MMSKSHRYRTSISWRGNLGKGTADYRSYSRNHDIMVEGKAVIPASADANFRGDPSRHTPEDLLVASLSGCHMLWYLHLCAVNNVVVVEYTDDAEGKMIENDDGSGQFEHVTLYPRVVVSEPSMKEKAASLHLQANKMCFIARSVTFPVRHHPEVTSYQA